MGLQYMGLFRAGPAVCLFLCLVQKSRWHLCAWEVTSAAAEPSCWTAPPSYLLWPKYIWPWGRGAPCSWTSCGNWCCFPSWVFTGLLICLSLEDSFDSVLPKGKRTATAESPRLFNWSTERFRVLWIGALVAATSLKKSKALSFHLLEKTKPKTLKKQY